MKHILLFFICYIIFVNGQSQTAEQRIKNFWRGFETKDWNIIAAQLADGFTFTSPNNDDHINVARFKEKCWAPGSKFFQHIKFQKILIEGNAAFLMYNITTTADSRIVHNVEYYTFSDGKIKSIETFFGAGIGFPGHDGNVK
jgi:hypothetical protein